MVKELTQYQQRDNIQAPEVPLAEYIPVRNGEILVNYWVGQEMTEVWVLADRRIVRHLKLPISRDELCKLVQTLRAQFDAHWSKPPDLAKQDLRKEPEYAHPFYWAGFILVGERDLSSPSRKPVAWDPIELR